MKHLVLLLVTIGLAASLSPAAEPMNKNCPITGKPAVAANKTVYVKTIALCCNKCKAKFEETQGISEQHSLRPVSGQCPPEQESDHHASHRELQARCHLLLRGLQGQVRRRAGQVHQRRALTEPSQPNKAVCRVRRLDFLSNSWRMIARRPSLANMDRHAPRSHHQSRRPETRNAVVRHEMGLRRRGGTRRSHDQSPPLRGHAAAVQGWPARLGGLHQERALDAAMRRALRHRAGLRAQCGHGLHL